LTAIKERIRRCWSGEVLWECPLANYSTLKVGGSADAVILPKSKDELVQLVGRLTAEQLPWRVIGRGSNILVADQGVDGVVIILGRDFGTIRQLSEATGPQLLVEAGCSLTRLSNWCSKRGLSGLEFVIGIPGSVGGAIIMNAGAWGSEIGQVVRAVELLDPTGQLECWQLTPEDFCYRGWRQPHGKVVVAGVFAVSPDDTSAINERCQRYAKQRAAKQPKGVASAGSFFKNPPGEAAGRLIEQAGLKGLRVGGAQVSSVHANFLINLGTATADDFQQLMMLVQKKVHEQFAVHLHPEVEFLGRWDKSDEEPLNE